MPGPAPEPQPEFTKQPPALPDGVVQIGVVSGTHGYDGRMRVESTTANPARFAPGAMLLLHGEPHTVESSGPGPGGVVLLKLSGIASREQAREHVGAALAVREADIPAAEPGTYYHFQLLGMQVDDASGSPLGTLTEVIETGSNDVYVVTGEGQEWLLPALADVVTGVDVEHQRMVVAIPDGLEPRPLSPPKPKRPVRRRRRGPPRPPRTSQG